MIDMKSVFLCIFPIFPIFRNDEKRISKFKLDLEGNT